jgi:hypothetical protein
MDSYVLQHFKWDGERWSAERNLSIGFTTPTSLGSLGADVTGSDDLGVIFAATSGDLSTGDLKYEMMSTNRSLQATAGETTPLPAVAVTPARPTATPAPQVTDTPAPTPTPTEANTPTPTFWLVSSNTAPSNSAWIGSVAGVIVAAVIVLLIILGIVAMRFRGPAIEDHLRRTLTNINLISRGGNENRLVKSLVLVVILMLVSYRKALLLISIRIPEGWSSSLAVLFG